MLSQNPGFEFHKGLNFLQASFTSIVVAKIIANRKVVTSLLFRINEVR